MGLRDVKIMPCRSRWRHMQGSECRRMSYTTEAMCAAVRSPLEIGAPAMTCVSIRWREELEGYSLSKSVIQELVAPQVALQPTNVQTVRVVQTVEASQLHREPDLVASVLLSITIDSVEADGGSSF